MLVGVGISPSIVVGKSVVTNPFVDYPDAQVFDFTKGVVPSPFTFTRASTATYLGADGYFHSVTTDTPRFEHDAITGKNLGILVESGNSIGQCLYSEDLTNAVWTKTGVNAFGATDTGALSAGSFQNTNRTLDIFGTNTAAFVQESSANSEHGFSQALPSVTSGRRYVITCAVKAAGRSKIGLYFNTTRFAAQFASFDLVAGTSSGTGAAAGTATRSIRPLKNGWWLISVSINSTSAGTGAEAFIRILDDSGTLSYTGDDTKGVYFCNCRVDMDLVFLANPFISTSSQVTRAGDNLNILQADLAAVGLNNGAEATIVVSAIPTGEAGTGAVSIVSLDIDANNRFQFRQQTQRLAYSWRLNGSNIVTGFNDSTLLFPPYQKLTLGAAWRTGYQKGSANGITEKSGTAAIASYAPIIMRVGNGQSDTFPKGTAFIIQRIVIFNRALSESELNAITLIQ